MEIIDQRTKKIMEDCKVRARKAGLQFDNESLEYIVTNKDLIELSPKVMIPTLYDYWVHDVEVLKGIGKYKLYPSNPYETVINTRPAISFYNDNNPDWLNTMIFYHVLGHIDFFQNNIMFQQTWDDDFAGRALADKRLIASLRSEHGRWVDYVIEFSRSIDNTIGFFSELSLMNFPAAMSPSDKVAFYFDVFLQEQNKVPEHQVYKEVERFNELVSKNPDVGESAFFSEVKLRYPEFQAKYEKFSSRPEESVPDTMQFIIDNSPFLKKEDNHWMKSVMSIVRNTGMYFSPQGRSKIINEGWASYWHDELFRGDGQIKTHEVDYARTNAWVTSISRIGLNPYAIGLRLIQYVEELADKGKLSVNYQRMLNIDDRENYDRNTSKGKEAIFSLRKNFSDFMLINTFVDQDFVDKHELFVVGQRLNEQRGTIEYYVKSRKAEDYKKMLLDSLYHPPYIKVDLTRSDENNLYLIHEFEGKQLYKPYIPDTMIGIEYLWGGQVHMETTEMYRRKPQGDEKPPIEYRKVLYSVKDRKISKRNI